MQIKKVNVKDWEKEGIELFGEDRKDWKFKCPNCGMIQSVNGLNEKYSALEGYFYATIFCRCLGWIDPEVGCQLNLDEKGGTAGVILVIDDEEGHREVPIFDFARPEDIN